MIENVISLIRIRRRENTKKVKYEVVDGLQTSNLIQTAGFHFNEYGCWNAYQCPS